jgi:hypothetical protein
MAQIHTVTATPEESVEDFRKRASVSIVLGRWDEAVLVRLNQKDQTMTFDEACDHLAGVLKDAVISVTPSDGGEMQQSINSAVKKLKARESLTKDEANIVAFLTARVVT